MATIALPWGSWHGDTFLELPVPPDWNVAVPPMPTARELTDAELRRAFAEPIGTPPLRALAAGKRTAAIVVDDLSRPTPAARILPLVLDELAAGGMSGDQVRVLIGLATHRPLARAELLQKLGPLADELTVINHTPYENLVPMGTTSAGTPVAINRFYVETELRLTIGCVEPHPAYGFSGGAKLVFPGLAGIDGIFANHRPGHLAKGMSSHHHTMRRDAEEAVAFVGLDAVINAVVCGRREIAGLFVGAYVAAHRAAAEFAKQAYATMVAAPADLLVVNAYPKDTELIQVNNALNAAAAATVDLLVPDGVVVITTAASEGVGYHALAGPGGRMFERPPHPYLVGRRVLVYCPHGRTADLPASIPRGTQLYRTWSNVVGELERLLPPRPTVMVLPEGPLQLPVPATAPS